MQTADFDYILPPELIAAHPPAERGTSRLLVLNRKTCELAHRAFQDLSDYVSSGDVLVINDSKVLRARLRGQRQQTGGAVELLLLERANHVSTKDADTWNTLARPAKKLKPGELIRFGSGELIGEVVAAGVEGERLVKFNVVDVLPYLERLGELPLPPYIVSRRRDLHEDSEAAAEDGERYQTVFAREPGSVAAPTAGLHFTQELLQRLSNKGVQIARVTLHVGAGTFKPVEVDDPALHNMHSEHYEVSANTSDTINAALSEGRRIVAVGTTAVRTLESAYDPHTRLVRPGSASTRLLILPGYRFNVVGALITNFHLPKSTLLMLVSAFASREAVLAAYHAAIEHEYRFYSYGDAMLIM
jgi:S-adenosylmethionine:tRNA ribosyltransferase-isomerase